MICEVGYIFKLRRHFFAVALQNIERDAIRPTLVSISADVDEKEFGFALNREITHRQ